MLKLRLISGLLLMLATLVLALYLPPVVAVLLLALLVFGGMHECLSMLARIGLDGSRRVAMTGAMLLLAGTFASLSGNWVSRVPPGVWQQTVLALTVLAAFVSRFRDEDRASALRSVAATLFALLYVAYLASFFIPLAFAWEMPGAGRGIGRTGCRVILYLALVVKSTDVGAYTFGRLFGRHKLVPSLSPGKTWEGAVGGVAVAMLCSVSFVALTQGCMGQLHFTIVDGIVLGIILPIVGQVGDLCESLLKRGCDVKDSGSTIPGMGGVLDVLDSLLFGAPVLYLYLCWK